MQTGALQNLYGKYGIVSQKYTYFSYSGKAVRLSGIRVQRKRMVEKMTHKKSDEKRIPDLPKLPGVYLFKDAHDTIIYIGKAKSLLLRVRSYFQKYNLDWKVKSLLDEYASIEHIIVNSESEALVLEAELIQKHKPKFNSLLKEGNPFVFIMYAERKNHLPELKIVRYKKEKGRYFGPFIHKTQARKTLKYLTRTFTLFCCNKTIENGCLDYHLGNCAGSCLSTFDRDGYRFRMSLAVAALEKDHARFTKELGKKIKEYSAQMAFEKARNLKFYLESIDIIFATIKTAYSAQKYADQIVATTTPKRYVADLGPDIAERLQEFFETNAPIQTIDCFDISHFQSQFIVGSCIRFTNGIPEKNKFRRFKIRLLTQQNDYAALQEIVGRRYSATYDFPDLILIDGGKGQLSAAQMAFPGAHMASLAKREERVFSTQFPEGKVLDLHDQVGRVLIALRDYAHHFAISYHRLLRSKYLSK